MAQHMLMQALTECMDRDYARACRYVHGACNLQTLAHLEAALNARLLEAVMHAHKAEHNAQHPRITPFWRLSRRQNDNGPSYIYRHP